MFSLIKELADRFIEFVLAMVKGETLEAQLTSALKSAIFLVTILGFVIVGLLVSNLNLRIQIADMEVGISKVNLLFDTEDGSPLKGFLKVNDLLSTQNNATKEENIQLLTSNIKMGEELNWLRIQLVETLEQNALLKDNNKAILMKCFPKGLPPDKPVKPRN